MRVVSEKKIRCTLFLPLFWRKGRKSAPLPSFLSQIASFGPPPIHPPEQRPEQRRQSGAEQQGESGAVLPRFADAGEDKTHRNAADAEGGEKASQRHARDSRQAG